MNCSQSVITELGRTMLKQCRRQHYVQQVGWTIDTLGWRGAPVQDTVARSLRIAAPNAIYVMHVGIQSRDGPALPTIIEGLREQGYGFASVEALNGN
jgi:peptidoglycan-N-acetylglucosamine deacetylase